MNVRFGSIIRLGPARASLTPYFVSKGGVKRKAALRCCMCDHFEKQPERVRCTPRMN